MVADRCSSRSWPCEAHDLSGLQLCGQVDVGGAHHPDDGVAARHRVVVEEQDRCPLRGTWIAPRTMPSLGSSASTLWRRRWIGLPSTRIPLRSLRDDTDHVVSLRIAKEANQCKGGPGSTQSCTRPEDRGATGGQLDVWVAAGCAARSRAPGPHAPVRVPDETWCRWSWTPGPAVPPARPGRRGRFATRRPASRWRARDHRAG